MSIRIDSIGRIYVAGTGAGKNYPLKNAFDSVHLLGVSEGFVCRYAPLGDSLEFSSYLGGDNEDVVQDMTIDQAGNMYVIGSTGGGVPIRKPFDGTYNGGFDAFITKIAKSNDSIASSTYFGSAGGPGGNTNIPAWDIEVDRNGTVHILFTTFESNLPFLNAFDSTANGGSDAYYAAFRQVSDSLVLKYTSYIGGSSSDLGQGMVIEEDGSATIMGRTNSTDFYVDNAYDSTLGGGSDAYVISHSCCIGSPGNVNGSVTENPTVADVTALVSFLFNMGAAPSCLQEANVNGTGGITVADLTYLANFIFNGGPPPPACP